MKKRIDPHTNEEFVPKRSNHKFANAKNRQDYHNAKAKKLRKEKAAFDKPMHQNYKIIDELMANKNKIMESKEFLRGKGFNQNAYHHMVQIEGKTGYALYNFILIYSETHVTILRNN